MKLGPLKCSLGGSVDRGDCSMITSAAHTVAGYGFICPWSCTLKLLGPNAKSVAELSTYNVSFRILVYFYVAPTRAQLRLLPLHPL